MKAPPPPGRALSGYGLAFFAYLYLPILVLVVYSFNASRYGVRWTGATLGWYEALLADRYVRQAAWNTLVVATVSTTVATVLGTAAALALARYRFRLRGPGEALMFLPVVVPEVVMGIALLALFALAGVRTGLGTVILGHIAFALPFVVLTVRARLQGFDLRLEEAARDLGATPWRAFTRVTLPLILPGVLGGALLAFTLSLDDYIITLFTTGPGATTLPLRVYSMIRQSLSPKINALSTLWILSVFVILAVVQWLDRRGAGRAGQGA